LGLEALRRALQRRHDAIDLRQPGIGHDRELHGAAPENAWQHRLLPTSFVV
jgi:hypothetical protein